MEGSYRFLQYIDILFFFDVYKFFRLETVF